MLKDLDLKQIVKSGVVGSNNSAYICFKINGANKCAFNFMGVDPIENESLAEFLDRTSADINLESWSKTNEDGEIESHSNFTVRLSFE